MKQTLRACALLPFLCFPAWADEITPQMKAAEELIQLMHMDQLSNNAIKQLEEMLNNQIQELLESRKQELNAKEEEVIKNYQSKMIDLMRSHLFSSIQADSIKIYASAFTAAELQELVTFYKSPIGVKIIERMPQLMQQIMQMMQAKMREISPKMDALTQEMKAEMATAHQDKQEKPEQK